MIVSYEEFLDRLLFTCDPLDVTSVGKCSFIIHKACTENTPKDIQNHPFHPQHDLALSFGHHLSSDQDICNACGDDLKMGFVYKCSSTPHCSFALDVKCAFLTLADISKILLPPHPHRLFSCHKGMYRFSYFPEPKYFSYSCTCCKLPSIDNDASRPIRGSRTVLVCLECKALFLHQSCAEIPWTIEKHPFHPSHPLLLLPRVPNPGPCFTCNLCRQKKQDGFAYHCPQCSFFLDVRCASLKPKRDNWVDNDFQQLSHFHPLIVCEEDEKKTFFRTSYSCGACGHPFPFQSKIYYSHECKCLLDESCADQLVQDIKHVLHPDHELTFWYRPLLSGYRKCRACLSSIGDSGYECFECGFYLDIKCAMLNPTVLTSPLHRKPLIFHEEADRKQCCNVCKQPCDTSFYRSLARDYAVHVLCLETFPTEYQSVLHRPHLLTLRTLPQPNPLTVRLFKKEQESFFCQVCHRKELGNPVYSCEICRYNAHPHCVYTRKRTFQEFKKSLESDENETKEVESVLQAFGKMDKSNWLYYSHTATTDIEMPSQKLRFPPWENWDAESKVIEIKTGIWILEDFAPLLDALVKKYGDFFSGPSLSPFPKMLFVTTVCEVLRNMSITNVTDVTKNLLLTWFQGFALGKHAGLDMAFAFDRLLRVATAQFGLHAGLFIDPNFALFGDDEVDEQRALVLHSPMSLGKFKLLDELKELGKEREKLEKTLKGERSMYEWKKEWLTDTLELMREKAFVIPL
ncbi:hypothetical protein Vadar_005511 [Vaccinium darrowii]|uniref:Uncharacterized protein n=1 Tax=Vaccinium darrowii TaxID=229202 RepID=A0ACB7YJY6_9ERIC|nr:hypothetical protein Vadar_005511 [Vaccinium darrowii]